MISVYVETSFFSACVTDRGDPQSIVWRDTSRRWWQTHRRRFDLCISEEVIAELSAPGFMHGPEALEMLAGLKIAKLSPEVQGLASLLVKEKVMPAPSTSGDAIHVAAATLYATDYLLGWNVKTSGQYQQTRASCQNMPAARGGPAANRYSGFTLGASR